MHICRVGCCVSLSLWQTLIFTLLTLIFLIWCFGSLFWLRRVPIRLQFHKNIYICQFGSLFVVLGPYFGCKGSLFLSQTVPRSLFHKDLVPNFYAHRSLKVLKIVSVQNATKTLFKTWLFFGAILAILAVLGYFCLVTQYTLMFHICQFGSLFVVLGPYLSFWSLFWL